MELINNLVFCLIIYKINSNYLIFTNPKIFEFLFSDIFFRLKIVFYRNINYKDIDANILIKINYS